MPDPSLAELAAEMAVQKLPVLFVDTCAVLDIVRCAERGRPQVLKACLQVLEASANGELLLCTSSVMREEDARNLSTVEAGANRHANAMDESLKAYGEIFAAVGVAHPIAAGQNHASVVPDLIKVREKLLRACRHLAPYDEVRVRAGTRCGRKMRPARRGGGYNDCVLLLEFRDLALRMPTASPMVLLTTNTDDFGGDKPGNHMPHVEIIDELSGTSAAVILNWPDAARAVLQRHRWSSF